MVSHWRYCAAIGLVTLMEASPTVIETPFELGMCVGGDSKASCIQFRTSAKYETMTFLYGHQIGILEKGTHDGSRKPLKCVEGPMEVE